MVVKKKERVITSIEGWKEIAPPKAADKHWQEGRSAKECAKAWLETPGAVPAEISSLLGSHPDFAHAVVDEAEPEALVYFDGHSGPRNSDLALRATMAKCVWP